MRDYDLYADMVGKELSTFLALYLYPIRHILRPLSDDEMWKIHLSSNDFGPDFLHRPHVPRMNLDLGAAARYEQEYNLKGRDTEKYDTRAFLNRICDILMMTTITWGDINIFIASMFSSFSEYSLLW